MHFTTLYRWMRSLGSKKAKMSIRRVKISPFSGLGEAVVAEIALGNGTRVRVMRGCGEVEMGIILEAVKRCGS